MKNRPSLLPNRLQRYLLLVVALAGTACAEASGSITVPLPIAAMPTTATLGWLTFYTAIVVAASLLGGWIPGRVTLTHARIQHIISFVAGLMLGIALLHLLPHAISLGDRLSVDLIVGFVLLGILAMFLLLRAFHFHVHEPEALVTDSGDGPSPVVVEHECSSPAHSHHSHDHDHNGHQHPEPGAGFGWAGVFFGLAMHTIIDGVALGAAMTADLSHDAMAMLPGAGILAAIALHKPLDSMSITSLMAVDGWSKRAQNWTNILFALLCPIGAGLFLFGMSFGNNSFVALALAFSAGVFLCIALSDLLPEMEFHTHDRITLSISLGTGVALALAIRFLEPGHLHN